MECNRRSRPGPARGQPARGRPRQYECLVVARRAQPVNAAVGSRSRHLRQARVARMAQRRNAFRVLVNSAKDEVAVWTKLPAAVALRSPYAAERQRGDRLAQSHCTEQGDKSRVASRTCSPRRSRRRWLGIGAVRGGRRGSHFSHRRRQGVKIPVLTKERASLVATAVVQDVAFAVMETTPHDVKMHFSGDPEKPGAVVPRAGSKCSAWRPTSREDRQRAT